jgi:hypothetical protein
MQRPESDGRRRRLYPQGRVVSIAYSFQRRSSARSLSPMRHQQALGVHARNARGQLHDWRHVELSIENDMSRELTGARYGPADRYSEWLLNEAPVTERVFKRARALIAAGNDERALRLLERTLPYNEPFRSQGWPATERFLARDCSASYHLLDSRHSRIATTRSFWQRWSRIGETASSAGRWDCRTGPNP